MFFVSGFILKPTERAYPMDTFSSIRHRFDVEIPRGEFVEIRSILKGESTWKWWHRFDVDISTWIRLSKSTKYRWVLHVDFSMSFRRQIDVTSALCFHSIIFWHFLLWEPILNYSGIMLSRCNFNDIDVITDFGIIGTIFFGNISTMQINTNNDKFYFLQNNTNRNYNANMTKNKTYPLQNNTNQSF